MTIDDQLAELLAAWRDDVDSVPHPPMPRIDALIDELEAA